MTLSHGALHRYGVTLGGLALIIAIGTVVVTTTRPEASTLSPAEICISPSPAPSLAPSPIVDPPVTPSSKPTPTLTPTASSQPTKQPTSTPSSTSSPVPSAASTSTPSSSSSPNPTTSWIIKTGLVQVANALTPAVNKDCPPPKASPSPSSSPEGPYIGIETYVTVKSWTWRDKPQQAAGLRKEKQLEEFGHGADGVKVKLFKESTGEQVCDTKTAANDGRVIFNSQDCPALESGVAYTIQAALTYPKDKIYYFSQADSKGIMQIKGILAVEWNPDLGFGPGVGFSGYRPVIAGELFDKEPSDNTAAPLKKAFNVCQQYKEIGSPACPDQAVKQQQAKTDYYLLYLDNDKLDDNDNIIGLDSGSNEDREISRWRSSRNEAWKTDTAWKKITANKTAPNRYDLFVKEGDYEVVKLNVPGVMQARGGQCGVASSAMVILYEKHTWNDKTWITGKKKPWPDGKVAPYSSKEPDATYPQPFPKTVGGLRGGSCVGPSFLDREAGMKGWAWPKSGSLNYQEIVQSIRDKHPVLIYTNGLYFNTNHIVVIRGFKWKKNDPNTLTFYINNPYVNGVDVHTTRSWKEVRATMGRAPYSHDAIIYRGR